MNILNAPQSGLEVELFRVVYTLNDAGSTGKISVALDERQCTRSASHNYEKEFVDTKHRAFENFKETLATLRQKLADDRQNLKILEEMFFDLVQCGGEQGISRTVVRHPIEQDVAVPLTANIDAPPLRHQRFAGHHWVMVGFASTTEYDQRQVMQWAPGAAGWVASGTVGAGGVKPFGKNSPLNAKIKWLEAIPEPSV